MGKDWIIVGLGNPGKNYERTRHNIGFMVLDALCSSEQLGATWRERSGSLTMDARIGNFSCVLAKPQSFMNISGRPVRELCEYFEVARTRLIVLHDDLDLTFGRLKIKDGGGEGGHNGLKSLSKELGGSDYLRIKLGIGRPQIDPSLIESGVVDKGAIVSDHVLGRFDAVEAKELPAVLSTAAKAVVAIIERGVSAAQGLYNQT